jgi:hypothetical protein
MGEVTPLLSQRVRLSHTRVMAASIAARSRPVPSYGWYLVALLAVMALTLRAGDMLVFWFVQQLPFEWMFAIGTYLPVVLPTLLLVFGVVVVSIFYDRLVRKSYLRQMRRLDIPLEIDALYEIVPEGLRLITERIEIFPKWHAVDTVSQVADGWVVSADQLTVLIPSESFADLAEERRFMEELLAHVPSETRTRSAQAVAFAEAHSNVS